MRNDTSFAGYGPHGAGRTVIRAMVELLDPPPNVVSARSALALHISGTARLLAGGRAIPVGDRRAAALLALLGIEGNAWTRRVARLLWPALDERAALAELDRLRAALDDASANEVIAGTQLLHLGAGIGVRVGPSDEELDALPDASSAPALLDAHRYDDLLEFDQWLDTARMRLLRIARMHFSDRAAEFERAADVAGALIQAQRALALDRRNEDCVRTVMRLYVKAGRPMAALEVFSRCNALMQARHGTALSADVRALAQAISRDATHVGPFDTPGAAWML